VERGLTDTDPETERVHLAMLRAASPSQRLRLALSLSRTVMDLSRAGIARRHPGASPEEVGLIFVEMNYGHELAEELRADLARRKP
jgi:hypothetical protein